MPARLEWIMVASLVAATPALANPPTAGRQQATARAALLHSGCTSIVDLQRNQDGSWTGQCTKGGSIVPVNVGKNGAVSSPVAPPW
jgi:hypothetical protein